MNKVTFVDGHRCQIDNLWDKRIQLLVYSGKRIIYRELFKPNTTLEQIKDFVKNIKWGIEVKI